jgi:DNA repair protein RecO (recombination protein O)
MAFCFALNAYNEYMEYRFTGIVLSKHDVGETDRIYTIYTLEGGKIRSLAKGVRKPHAKLASSLENITLSDIVIIRTKGLGKITSSIVENNFTFIKCDCDALLETFAALTIFEKLVDFENPDEKVFVLLKDYLEAVNTYTAFGENKKQLLIRLGFTVKLLDFLGWTIEVDNCVSCGKTLSKDFLCFSSQQGGTLCEACSGDKEKCIVNVKANTIKMLRLFLRNNMRDLYKINADREDCDSVRFVVEDFMQWNI